MIKFKKGYILKLINIVIAAIFTIDTAGYGYTLPSQSSLRVPLMVTTKEGQEKLAEALSDKVDANNFASMPTDQLIREAENSMPFCEDKNPDWARFNEIVKQLKTRKDVEVFVLAGPMFKDNGTINTNRLTQPETVISSNEAEFDFLWCTFQNISQHVERGIALVVKQKITTERRNKYTEISVIDNGTGPIDKNGKRVSVKEVLKYGVTKGESGSAGRGLTLAARQDADLSTIHAPGISMIVNGSEMPDHYRVSPPEIIWEQDKSKKPYGMTVIGYFLGKGADKEDVKEDIIRRAEQHVNSFQPNQMYGIREKDMRSRKPLDQAI